MLTQIITFLIFVAVIGCILYGRRLIRTEKIDAVFGNPERALGGTHWVIVGSSFLLLVWLYYSWDIAKGFYPKSANELCQVAKVNDSLLGLKYQFPIEERELKSTSQIKKENKNLSLISNEIQNSDELNIQQKTILVSFINKTNQLIPLLTNEDLLENETKQKINNITGQINLLTENFQKSDYPFETEQELNDRLKAIRLISVTPPAAKQISKTSKSWLTYLERISEIIKPMICIENTLIKPSQRVLTMRFPVIPLNLVPSATPITN